MKVSAAEVLDRASGIVLTCLERDQVESELAKTLGGRSPAIQLPTSWYRSVAARLRPRLSADTLDHPSLAAAALVSGHYLWYALAIELTLAEDHTLAELALRKLVPSGGTTSRAISRVLGSTWLPRDSPFWTQAIQFSSDPESISAISDFHARTLNAIAASKVSTENPAFPKMSAAIPEPPRERTPTAAPSRGEGLDLDELLIAAVEAALGGSRRHATEARLKRVPRSSFPGDWYLCLLQRLLSKVSLSDHEHPHSSVRFLARCLGPRVYYALACAAAERQELTLCRSALQGIVTYLNEIREADLLFVLGGAAPPPALELELQTGNYQIARSRRSSARSHEANDAIELLLDKAQVDKALAAADALWQINSSPTPRSAGRLLNALLWAGRTSDAISLMQKRASHGPSLNCKDFAIALNAFRRREDVAGLRTVVQLYQRQRPQLDQHLCTELILAYSILSDLGGARRVLDDARSQGVRPNSHMLTALMSATEQHGTFEDVESIFSEMAAVGLEPDNQAFTVLMRAAVNAGRQERACELFAELVSHGLTPDSGSFFELIRAHGSAARPERAREALREMRRAGLEAGRPLYSVLIAAFARQQRFEEAQELLEEMRGLAEGAGAEEYRAIMLACNLAGRPEKTLELFRRMETDGLTHECSHFALATYAYGEIGQPRLATSTFEAMRARGLVPTEAEYRALLHGFARSGLAEEALDVFGQMVHTGIIPSNPAVGLVITALDRARRPHDAEAFLRKFWAGHTGAPSPVERQYAFNLLIRAYSRQDLVREAERLKEEMLGSGLVPDRFTLGPLQNSYDRLGTRDGEGGTLIGTQAEGWKELSILFQDVIHELNQPVGEAGLALLEFRTHMKNGAVERALACVPEIEDRLRIVGERLGVYRGLLQGANEVKTFRVADLIENTRQALQPQATRGQISLAITLEEAPGRPLLILGDPFMLRLAIRGLIQNAINALASSDGLDRRIVVTAIHTESRGESNRDWIDIYVRDNGPGVPDEIRDRIFDRGFTTKAERGLGLGLSLVQSVAESHGGRVVLTESRPGAEFWLRVPAAQDTTEEVIQ